MKKNLIYILLLLSACTSGFDELNKDPNNPIEASMPSVMLQAQRTITHTHLDDNNIFQIMVWVQHHGNLGYSDQVYDYDWNIDATFNNECYVLGNLEKLRKTAIAKGHPNYEAIAMIMEVWIFANWTDMNGDIPYSESLLGEEERILYPKYDDQKSIYFDLTEKLKTASEIINLNDGEDKIDGESDLFCQGKMLKWKKLANTLRARLFLRMSEVEPKKAKEGLEQIFGDSTVYPVISSNEDNVAIKFIDETGTNRSTFVQQTIENNNLRVVGATMADLLCKNKDPRRTIFMNPTENSVDSVEAGVYTDYVYTGAPAALSNPMTSFDRKNVSTVGNAISSDWYRPIDVITYSELLFIKAEAATKGYSVGESDADCYLQAISASLQKWGANDQSEIDTYLSSSFVSFDSDKAKEQILTQRYIDGFHQALNTFAVIRRGGYPTLDFIKVGFALENGYPDRIPYSHNQRGGNPNFASIESSIVHNLWGNIWWATTTEVQSSPIYTKPEQYHFPQ